jgi:CheY-like chemotaxis protein
VSKTLLAVDDSATMRKVLEITFNGEDFNVVVAEGHQSALGKLGDKPAVCVIDPALGSEDGYALAKEIRKRDPQAAIVMLASRYNPYDAAKGKDAGADDFMDKPFDTQQAIDKVRKALLSREGAGAGAAAAPAKAPVAQPLAAAAAAANVPKTTQPSMGGQRHRAATLVFGAEAPPMPEAAPAASPKPAAAAPAPKPAAAAPVAAAVPAVSGAVNGHLAGKIGELGLSPAQADAVLALSREVVEKVIWEVVPQLAEALIKDEIARLTKEG